MLIAIYYLYFINFTKTQLQTAAAQTQFLSHFHQTGINFKSVADDNHLKKIDCDILMKNAIDYWHVPRVEIPSWARVHVKPSAHLQAELSSRQLPPALGLGMQVSTYSSLRDNRSATFRFLAGTTTLKQQRSSAHGGSHESIGPTYASDSRNWIYREKILINRSQYFT